MIDIILAPVVKELGLGILLRATLIMAMSTGLVFMLKRSSAAVRHTIWGTAFLALVLLPFVTYSVPEWAVLQIDNSIITDPIYSYAGRINPWDVDSPKLAGSGKIEDASNAGSGDAYRAEFSKIKAALSRVTIAILFSIWFLVAVFIIVGFLIQLLEVYWITRRAIRVEEGELNSEIGNLITSLDLRRPVKVSLSEEVSMPFAWGVFSPVIILPIDAGEWPADRIRSVMTHELAHITRWDCLIHTVIEIVRALYWPNPIVWFAARKSAMERERACDDFALRSGTPSADYASHLLHIARRQIEGKISIATVNMASKPGIRDRIDYVMAGKMNRSPLRKGVLIVMAALITFLALPIGSMAVRTNRWIIPDTNELIRQLSEGIDPAERSLAAWWLGEHETKMAVEPLLNALKDDSRIVRLVSVWALGEIKDRGSIDGPIRALETDRDFLVREMAVLALGEIENPSAVDVLEKAAKSDESLALAVIWALGEIGHKSSGDAVDLREKMLDRLGRHMWRNEQVWTGSLRRKEQSPKEVEILIDDLEKKDWNDRREAAINLGHMGIKQEFETVGGVEVAVRALIARLEDPLPQVRASAVWALDEINPSRKESSLRISLTKSE